MHPRLRARFGTVHTPNHHVGRNHVIGPEGDPQICVARDGSVNTGQVGILRIARNLRVASHVPRRLWNPDGQLLAQQLLHANFER